jgi:membrane-associated phospholipid phosphatase
MIDLSQPWPLGLTKANWGVFAAAFLAAMSLLLGLDHWLSVEAHTQKADILDFFNQLTRWGESDWLLIPSATLLAICGLGARLLPRRRFKLAFVELTSLSALIFVGIGLPSLVANIAKSLIGRSRPPIFDTVGSLAFHPFAFDFFYQSFPSGHTTTAFSAAIVLGFLAPRWFRLGLLYAVAIGTSRLVLGVHYPTDVLCGAVLGTLGAYAVRNYFAGRRWGFRRTRDGRIVARRAAALQRLVRPLQRKAAR